MRKKGFTLTELLVVIALIAVLVVIAVPAVRTIQKNIKTKEWESKIGLIETAAVLYAQDNIEDFPTIITVLDLLEEDYLEADFKKDENSCNDEAGCMINPLTNTIINDRQIEITKNSNNTITVELPQE